MKKSLYAGLAALMIMFFSLSASAATMDVQYGDLTYVNFQYHGKSGGYATEFTITLNDGVDWENFLTTAYCVDIDDYIYEEQYNVTLNPITGDSGNYLYAAWLMDQYVTGASTSDQKAGLQLAIWDAFYGESFTNKTGGVIGGYYTDYYQPASSNEEMWSSLGYNYAFTTYGQGIDAQELLVQLNPVPEPGTMLLLGMGIAGLGAAGRKRFKKQ
ncbi:MAG: PEP-CTERM sorting domain-containing protein [Desulfotignum sp.]|nr:PEP-CTERM sorting domain-containing protein [Desulfotignum sp.]